MKKISAVIACYKDAEAIPEMHQRLTSIFTASCSLRLILQSSDLSTT